MNTSPRAGAPRVGDVIAAAVAVGAAGYLVHRALPPAAAAGITLGLMAVIVTVVVTLGCLAILWALHRGKLTGRWRAVVYIVVILGATLAAQRWNAWREVTSGWPIDPRTSMVFRLDDLPPIERAEWGARVVAHAMTRNGLDLALPAIPEEWPFPTDLAIAIDSTADPIFVWSRTAEDTTYCMAIPRGPRPGSAIQACRAREGQWRGLAFEEPSRVPAPPAGHPGPPIDARWEQYRGDGARTAASDPGDPVGTGWWAATPGPIRASASVVGDYVLVGGHATGALTVLDRRDGTTRWRAWLPNWIHQDPISDGATVLVGFGANGKGFGGRSPGGIAAYDLASGRHLWTRFDESSVMTTGVLHGASVIYGTSAGVLRKRAVGDGALLDSLDLPGAVVMAPPVLVGDTVVASLDTDHVCAVLSESFTLLWCRRLPHLRALGHSAASAANGQVFLTGQGSVLGLTPADVGRLGAGMRKRLVSGLLDLPTHFTQHATGQVIVALDLATGSPQWMTRMFLFKDWVDGHVSGTPVISGSLGAVVMPVANTLAVFETATGAIRWSADGHRARGPVLVVRDQVVLTGRDGVIQVRDLATGKLDCEVRRTVGWDRGGPILAGNLVIMANLEGQVEALPIDDLLGCAVAPEPTPAAPGD